MKFSYFYRKPTTDISESLEYTRCSDDVERKTKVFIKIFDFVSNAKELRITKTDNSPEIAMFNLGAGTVHGVIGYISTSSGFCAQNYTGEFLGGSEPSTLKDLSQALGKETIDMYNTGESRGNNLFFSTNYQNAGKDLMTMDELAVLDGDKCILQLRGVRPFLSDKYDVTQHTLYQETGEYDERNKLDIEKYLKQGMRFKKGETYNVINIK